MIVWVAVSHPLGVRRTVGDFVSVSGPISLSLPVINGAGAGAVSDLVSDTFPPLHLLDPLRQVGVVGVDVVVGLLLVVSSAKNQISQSTISAGSQ